MTSASEAALWREHGRKPPLRPLPLPSLVPPVERPLPAAAWAPRLLVIECLATGAPLDEVARMLGLSLGRRAGAGAGAAPARAIGDGGWRRAGRRRAGGAVIPRRPAIPVTCRTCGGGFMRAPSLVKRRVYCSPACRCADRLPADVALARIRASKREHARRKRAQKRIGATT